MKNHIKGKRKTNSKVVHIAEETESWKYTYHIQKKKRNMVRATTVLQTFLTINIYSYHIVKRTKVIKRKNKAKYNHVDT